MRSQTRSPQWRRVAAAVVALVIVAVNAVGGDEAIPGTGSVQTTVSLAGIDLTAVPAVGDVGAGLGVLSAQATSTGTPAAALSVEGLTAAGQTVLGHEADSSEGRQEGDLSVPVETHAAAATVQLLGYVVDADTASALAHVGLLQGTLRSGPVGVDVGLGERGLAATATVTEARGETTVTVDGVRIDLAHLLPAALLDGLTLQVALDLVGALGLPLDPQLAHAVDRVRALSGLLEEIDSALAEVAAAEDAVNALVAQDTGVAEAQAAVDAAQTALDDAVADLADAQADLAAAIDTRDLAQATVDAAQAGVDAAQATVDAAQAAVDAAQATVDAAVAEVDAIQAEIDALNAELATLDPVLDALRIDEIDAELAALDTELTAAQADLAAAEADLAAAQADLADAQADLAAAEATLDQATADLAATQAAVDAAQAVVADAQAAVDDAQAALDAALTDLAAALNAAADLSGVLGAARDLLAQAQAELDRLLDELADVLEGLPDLTRVLAELRAALTDAPLLEISGLELTVAATATGRAGNAGVDCVVSEVRLLGQALPVVTCEQLRAAFAEAIEQIGGVLATLPGATPSVSLRGLEATAVASEGPDAAGVTTAGAGITGLQVTIGSMALVGVADALVADLRAQLDALVGAASASFSTASFASYQQAGFVAAPLPADLAAQVAALQEQLDALPDGAGLDGLRTVGVDLRVAELATEATFTGAAPAGAGPGTGQPGPGGPGTAPGTNPGTGSPPAGPTPSTGTPGTPGTGAPNPPVTQTATGPPLPAVPGTLPRTGLDLRLLAFGLWLVVAGGVALATTSHRIARP